MGPSGSGKTTLLNLIGGIDRPTRARSRSAASASTSCPRASSRTGAPRNVGFVFQFYNLMPMLTRGAERRAAAAADEAVAEAAAQARRRPRWSWSASPTAPNHKPRELSGGQQQRVAIARAIVSDPKLLVCDEPTGDLDRTHGRRNPRMLQLLNREHGKTIVMVTHDPAAAKYARRTLHLDKGHFVEQELAA